MEREVSSMSHLAVAMVSVSLVLSLVWFTIFLGDSIRADAYAKAVDIQEGITSGNLQTLTYTPSDMPAAAAYSIIESNFNNIQSSKCMICNSAECSFENSASCLRTHIKGRVILEVTKDNASSLFNVVIHKENCKIILGKTCNCR